MKGLVIIYVGDEPYHLAKVSTINFLTQEKFEVYWTFFECF